MKMNKVWEFAVSPKQAAIIATCLLLAGIFLSGAGVVTGLLLAARRNEPQVHALTASHIPTVEKPVVKLPPAPVTEIKDAAAAPPLPVGTGLESAVLANPKPMVAPGPPTAATALKLAPLPIRMAVQVGSFSIEKNALEIVEHLKRFGYPAAAFESTDASSRHWHVVQVGPYAAYDDASRAAMELSGKYRLEPLIVPLTAFESGALTP